MMLLIEARELTLNFAELALDAQLVVAELFELALERGRVVRSGVDGAAVR